MSLRLSGSTSGYAEIDAPAVAGSNTLVLPASNGSAYQFLRNGATAGTTEFAAAITSGTAVASTSGTSIAFTGIPSYVKRITVMFDQVSTNGTSAFLVQLGDSGGIETTGYVGSGSNTGTASNNITGSTAGFILMVAAVAANNYVGSVIIDKITSNSWVSVGTLSRSSDNSFCTSAGSKSLSGTLDRIHITTVNGTDTFDAGTINILYEG